MTRWRKSLFSEVFDILMGEDQYSRASRQREDMFSSSMMRQYGYQPQNVQYDSMGYAYDRNGQIGYPGQYPQNGQMGYPGQYPQNGQMGYPGQNAAQVQAMQAGISFQDSVLAQNIKESMSYADEISHQKNGVYGSDDQTRFIDRLRADYLTFLGYLHDPESADPVRQVELVNKLLDMKLSTQAFFRHRNMYSMDPGILEKVPVSLEYFVKDDLSGVVRPKGSAMSMSRFLVNNFRDLGLVYVAFGGVSDLEIRRLKAYIGMMNDYLKENGLYRTMDPYRKGPKGDPDYGLPADKEEPEEDGKDDIFTHGIDMPSYKGKNMSSSAGIDMPSSKGIDMSSSVKNDGSRNDASEVRYGTHGGLRGSDLNVYNSADEGRLRRSEVIGSEEPENEWKGRANDPKQFLEKRELKALMEELEHLTGLARVKENLKNLINVISIRKVREKMGLPQPAMSMHLVFTGNPGTGKTTVARLLAKIYKALGVVSKGQLVEVDRAGLVEGFMGQTAQKTQEVIDKAIGGVLFIDEAYTLTNQKSTGDYGQEAVDTLLKRMEDDRDRFVVIVAGYSEPMEEFLNSNPGLRSRFSKVVEFDDYSEDELYTIFVNMCKDHDYQLTDGTEAVLKKHFHDIEEYKGENFANAREIRNFFERCIERQADRLAKEGIPDREEVMKFRVEDVTEDSP